MDLPRPLPVEFNRHDHLYHQILRSDKAALYRVEIAGKPGSLLAWEVVRVRTAKEAKLPGGKVAPFREVYPSDEDFGSHGWCYAAEDRAKADAKYKELHGPAL